jgi:general secretion pathway protein A
MKFKWKRNPFTLDIMPKLFTGYQTLVVEVIAKIHAKSGHILITGNKGVGKTSLLRWLAENLKKEFHPIYVPRPSENFDELVGYIADSLKVKRPKDKTYTVYDLEEIVKKSKKHILILLDEAHEFTPQFERPLRTLGDINGVNLVLCGLKETKEKIQAISPPFYERIVMQKVLEHMTPEETSDLIRKRIEDVGGAGIAPFTQEAIQNIFKMSGGVPRTILKVCDWLVTDAIRHELTVIGEKTGERLARSNVMNPETGDKKTGG